MRALAGIEVSLLGGPMCGFGGRTTNTHAVTKGGGGDSGEGRLQDWQADAKVRVLGEGNEPADASGAKRGEGEQATKLGGGQATWSARRHRQQHHSTHQIIYGRKSRCEEGACRSGVRQGGRAMIEVLCIV